MLFCMEREGMILLRDWHLAILLEERGREMFFLSLRKDVSDNIHLFTVYPLMHSNQAILELYSAYPWLLALFAALFFAWLILHTLPLFRSLQRKLPLVFACLGAVFIPLLFVFGSSMLYWFATEMFRLRHEQWPQSLVTLVLYCIVSWQLAKVVHALVHRKYVAVRSASSNSVSGLLRGGIYGSCIFLGIGLFLWQEGYSFTGVWVSTGLATALVGFALQQTLGDFFSGLAMGVEGGFRIGDWLRLEDGTMGAVIDINWRATWLHDWDNTTHIIPNSKLAKQGFTNLGGEYHYHRPWYLIKMPAEIDPRFAKQLLLEGIYRCKHVLKHPAPVVRLENASTIPYTYMCWICFPNYLSMFRGREEFYREVHYVLQQAGVTPAPVITEWRGRRAEVPVAEPPTIQLALKSQGIFSSLAEEEIEALARASQQLYFDVGAPIQYEAGEADAFNILISGMVEVSIELPNGKQLVTGELGPGESYGLVSMFTDHPIHTQWMAQTDVTLIRIDFETMKKLLHQHPEVADRIAAVVKQRQDEAEYLRVQNSVQPPASSLREIKQYIRQMLKRDKRKESRGR